jgi:hypothetical protein
MKSVVLCSLLVAVPVTTLADSIALSAASSASLTASSASQSLNSASSSANSSKGGNTASAGDFRIEAVAAAEQPGKVRLVLQPLQPTSERRGFVLTLPQAALDAQALTRGDMVSVRERTYGFEFARADTRQAFFLVLADAWHRELDARPVTTAPLSL